MKIFKIDAVVIVNIIANMSTEDRMEFTKKRALSQVSVQRLINRCNDMNITVENIKLVPAYPNTSCDKFDKLVTYKIMYNGKTLYVTEHEKESSSAHGDHYPLSNFYGGYFNPSLHTIVREEEELRSFLQKLLDLIPPTEEVKDEETFDQLIERLTYESDPDNREELFMKYNAKR